MLKVQEQIKKTLFILLFLIPIIGTAQNYCIPDRFTDKNYFKIEDIDFDTSGVYGYAKNWKGKTDTLHYSIFYPKLTVDKLKKRPLIVFIHGGAFMRETREQDYKYCILLAQMGFVTASIDYRLGWDWKADVGDIPAQTKIGDKYFVRSTLDSTLSLAIYRATQDAHAALRYFSKNASMFGIDPDHIIIGGSSAGCTTSIALAYMSQDEFDALIPFARKTLGKIEGSTNTIRSGFKIKGVIGMWGGCADTSYISREEAKHIPLVSFHGTKDIGLTYDMNVGTPEKFKTISYGGYSIAARFKSLGACHQLNVKIGAGHGEFSKHFITKQASCFFKSVFCNECVSLEQENTNEITTCQPSGVDKK